MSDEWFTCPGCKQETKVSWPSGLASRDIDCVYCRKDVYEQAIQKDVNGNDVLDDNGNPFMIMEHTIVGKRYSIERGKGRTDG